MSLRRSARQIVGWRTALAVTTLLVAASCYAVTYLLADSNVAIARVAFAVALALAVASFVTLLRTRELSRSAGLWMCLLLALVFTLPKLFRSPVDFTFFDELSHVRAVQDLLAGHGLFTPNPVTPVVAHYPGLHVLTALVARVAHLSLFDAGTAIVITARIFMFGALLLLYRAMLGAERIAVLAVLVYAANPAFLFFDSQFSYESLALPLAVGAFALAFLSGIEARPARSLGLLGLSVAFSLATVVTHHISAYALTAVLLLFGACIGFLEPGGRRLGSRLALAGSAALVACVLWVSLAAPDTLHYLHGGASDTINGLTNFLTGSGQVRRPFAGSSFSVPLWEQATSYLGVLVLFVAFVAGLLVLRPARDRRGRYVACALIGALYFVSLPLQLLQDSSAAPIAPRVWEFAFLGLAPVVAIALAKLMAPASRGRTVAVVLSLFVALMSGANLRSGDNLRFPGPYIASGGPRAVTPDVVRAARWLRSIYGQAETVIMGDQTIASVFASYGGSFPATYQNYGYKPWTVFYSRTLTPLGRYELRRSGTDFVVVDRRVLHVAPRGGYYFSAAEPRHRWRTMPAAFLTKFDRLREFAKVYDSRNIAIYRYLPSPLRSSTRRAGA